MLGVTKAALAAAARWDGSACSGIVAGPRKTLSTFSRPCTPRFAPEIAKTNVALNPRDEPADRFDEFRRGGAFTDVEARAFPWSVAYDRADWIDLIATHSDHVRLPDARRRALLDAVADAVDALGGTLTYNYSTLLVLGTRGI